MLQRSLIQPLQISQKLINSARTTAQPVFDNGIGQVITPIVGPTAQNFAFFFIRQRLKLMVRQRAQTRIQIREAKRQLAGGLPVGDEQPPVHPSLTVMQRVVQPHQHLFGSRFVVQPFYVVH